MTVERSSSVRATCAACLLAVMSASTAESQVLTTLEFSFSNPGARSMGLAGAFLGLADDATAAFANPAGLVQLARPEISIEGRSWSYSTPYTRGGRAAGQPTGLGIDTVSEPVQADSEADLSGISFLSYVYPRKRWSLAVFQHQLMNFEMKQEIQGLFAPGTVYEGSYRGPIERGLFDLEVVTRGMAVGWRMSEALSLGVGISRFEPTVVLKGSEYLPDDDSREGYFAEAGFLPERLIDVRDGRDTTDVSWGLAAGLLWRLSDSWQLGGAYREGPELEMIVASTSGPAHRSDAGQLLETGTTSWTFPDVYGLGLAYRSSNGLWTASFEWTRVEYSTIHESLDQRFKTSGETIDDADELHLGGEYVILGSTPVVALRAGVWHDPDHRTKTESESPFIQAEQIPGSDELHVAAGVGLAFSSFQIDLGVDLSEFRDTAALSAIFSF